MDSVTILGCLAGGLTTLAYLPQLIKTWQSKSAEDISWSMLISLCTGIVLWLVYGSYVHDFPVIMANIVTLVFTSFILGLKIYYQRSKVRATQQRFAIASPSRDFEPAQ